MGMTMETVKEYIRQEKNKGNTSISIEEIEKRLDREDKVIPIEIAKLEMEHQRKTLIKQLAEQNILENQLENFKSTVSTGQNALKYAIIINGGATVAFIAFLNEHLAQINNSNELLLIMPYLIWALISFGVGTVLAGLGVGWSYFAQYGYWKNYNENIAPKIRDWVKKEGTLIIDTKMSWFHIGALALYGISYICTLVGIIFFVCGVTDVFKIQLF